LKNNISYFYICTIKLFLTIVRRWSYRGNML